MFLNLNMRFFMYALARYLRHILTIHPTTSTYGHGPVHVFGPWPSFLSYAGIHGYQGLGRRAAVLRGRNGELVLTDAFSGKVSMVC